MGIFAEAAKSDPKGAESHKVIERVYDKAGVYIQRIDKVEVNNFRDEDRKYFKASKTNVWVIDDNGGQGHQQWSEPAEFIGENPKGPKADRDRYFFKDVARVTAGMSGLPVGTISPEKLDSILEEKLLEGRFVRCQVKPNAKTKGDGVWFSRHYTPLSAEQVAEIVDDETRSRLGL